VTELPGSFSVRSLLCRSVTVETLNIRAKQRKSEDEYEHIDEDIDEDIDVVGIT